MEQLELAPASQMGGGFAYCATAPALGVHFFNHLCDIYGRHTLNSKAEDIKCKGPGQHITGSTATYNGHTPCERTRVAPGCSAASQLPADMPGTVGDAPGMLTGQVVFHLRASAQLRAGYCSRRRGELADGRSPSLPPLLSLSLCLLN